MIKSISYSFVFSSLIIILTGLRLIPFHNLPEILIAPDLVLAFVLVWCIRLPKNAPSLLIVVLFVLLDFIHDRPPGLFACLVFLASEWLKSRTLKAEEYQFISEWTLFALAVLGIFLAYRTVLWVTLLPLPGLLPSFLSMIITIAIYPLVTGFCRFCFGLRRYHETSFLYGDPR